jgi:SPP1 gp7 family putative phage head morphogenesis protein
MQASTFEKEIALTLADFMAASNIMGRLHVREEVRKKTGKSVGVNSLATFSSGIRDAGLVFEPVANKEAVEHIKNLTPRTRRIFDGLSKHYQKQTFTVAKLTNSRLVESVKKEVLKILSKGGTVDDFRRAVNRITDSSNIERLTMQHIETVFRTNIQTAYSAGRIEQQRDADVISVMPFWRYLTIGDDRTRVNHEAMDGFIALADDSVWEIWYPPAGFNCRCSVESLMEEEVDNVKEASTPGRSRMTALPDEGFV